MLYRKTRVIYCDNRRNTNCVDEMYCL